MLKRAKRISTQRAYSTPIAHTILGGNALPSANRHTSTAGAAPKVMASQSESNSAPNSDSAPVIRAAEPSKASNNMPMKIRTPATNNCTPSSQCDKFKLVATAIAPKPQTPLPSVNNVGSTDNVNRRCRRRPPRRPKGPRRRFPRGSSSAGSTICRSVASDRTSAKPCPPAVPSSPYKSRLSSLTGSCRRRADVRRLDHHRDLVRHRDSGPSRYCRPTPCRQLLRPA